MSAAGTYIYKERVEFAKRLTPVFQAMYSRIAQAEEEVRLTYASHCERGPLLDQLRQARPKERVVGFTLHGVHKDDLIMELGGFPIRKEGSQGQCKTYLVALKLAQFALLNEAFQHTFVELFRGGKATLELEDPEDILNCGIEIKVQPPGKALKVLSLLSGGEKAFVAIALYFAILKVRPTPFVVMDEIEAALDDANVVRFAHYMRQMADKTQFIVITHRRGTMEEADVLYGVTMQEQGISRMLTINLNDVEKELHIK